jgi:putative transposase
MASGCDAGIRFVTPAQRHASEDTAILARRAAVYEQAKQTHPDRSRGRATRNWKPEGTVWLNPDRGSQTPTESLPLAA